MKQLIVISIFLMLISGCDPYKNPLTENLPHNEILVYSGITMLDAVTELKKTFEKSSRCGVTVMYGASGYLEKVVEVNKIGDVFFPGSRYYLDDMVKRNLITQMTGIGYNTLCYFVEKGNPKMLNGSLDELKRKDLRVMIGLENAGAVGREATRLLKKEGVDSEVRNNAVSFSTDSKGLSEALRENKADLVVNWRSVGSLKQNKKYMDAVDIDSDYIRRVPVSIGILKYSLDRECAQDFIELTASKTGRKILQKYGFLTNE